MAAGDRLVAVAQESHDGNYWTLSTNCSTHYPNYSHGTAGIGYFLAELYEATRVERYRMGSLAAGRYLRSIVSNAEPTDCLIFHNDAGGRELFYLGWCHGPAGTGRFFYRLYQLTDDSCWLDLVKRQAATIIASGIPENQTPGYWNNVSRCCGAAGVGEFFLGLYTATGDRRYLAFARRVAVYLLTRAETDENGAKWTQAERRIEPEKSIAQTGLMQGAAGVGLFLVHVDEACRPSEATGSISGRTVVGDTYLCATAAEIDVSFRGPKGQESIAQTSYVFWGPWTLNTYEVWPILLATWAKTSAPFTVSNARY